MTTGRGRGFTLIEIMVALGVFALISVTVYTRIGEVLAQTRTLELRTLATWVARNRLTALVLEQHGADETLGTGRRSDLVTLGGHDWQVNTEIIATSTQALRRVEIKVAEEGGGTGSDARSAAFIIGFVGRD